MLIERIDSCHRICPGTVGELVGEWNGQSAAPSSELGPHGLRLSLEPVHTDANLRRVGQTFSTAAVVVAAVLEDRVNEKASGPEFVPTAVRPVGWSHSYREVQDRDRGGPLAASVFDPDCCSWRRDGIWYCSNSRFCWSLPPSKDWRPHEIQSRREGIHREGMDDWAHTHGCWRSNGDHD